MLSPYKLTIMIQTFIITVLVIYGVHATTREGMIFEYIGNKAYYIHPMLSKVLFDCTPCMASVYGSISYFIVVYPTHGLMVWPVWVFSLSGFNYILNKFLK